MAKKKRTFLRFEEWEEYDARREFGLTRLENYPPLTEWITVQGNIPEHQQAYIEELRFHLKEHERSWNETDYLMKFIGPLLTLINFTGQNYDNFGEARLTLRYHNHEISGYVDWLVATGRYEPQVPFFFLHEYKRMRMAQSDPLGQLLIAMIAAQQANTRHESEDAQPPKHKINDNGYLYGCYVVGNVWRFVILNGKEYSLSQAYDSTDPTELTTIYLILQKTKAIIEAQVEHLPYVSVFE